MIRNFVVCLAVTTFSHFDCKEINAIHTTENPKIHINNFTIPQNETLPLRKNSTVITQKNETLSLQKNRTAIAQKNETTVVKNDHLETNRKPKTRQVSEVIPVPSTAAVTDDMNAEQSYYPSALMVYPFPMMNTYYPRYFPYTYAGYQGYPVYG